MRSDSEANEAGVFDLQVSQLRPGYVHPVVLRDDHRVAITYLDVDKFIQMVACSCHDKIVDKFDLGQGSDQLQIQRGPDFAKKTRISEKVYEFHLIFVQVKEHQIRFVQVNVLQEVVSEHRLEEFGLVDWRHEYLGVGVNDQQGQNFHKIVEKTEGLHLGIALKLEVHVEAVRHEFEMKYVHGEIIRGVPQDLKVLAFIDSPKEQNGAGIFFICSMNVGVRVYFGRINRKYELLLASFLHFFFKVHVAKLDWKLASLSYLWI